MIVDKIKRLAPNENSKYSEVLLNRSVSKLFFFFYFVPHPSPSSNANDQLFGLLADNSL